MTKLPPISAFGEDANPEDDWTKLPLGDKRRRSQNKLAQRKYRRKKMEGKVTKKRKERHPTLPPPPPPPSPPSPPSTGLQPNPLPTFGLQPAPIPQFGLQPAVMPLHDLAPTPSDGTYAPPANGINDDLISAPVFGNSFESLNKSQELVRDPLGLAQANEMMSLLFPDDNTFNFQDLSDDNTILLDDLGFPADWYLYPPNSSQVDEAPVTSSGRQDIIPGGWAQDTEGSMSIFQ